VLNQLEQLRADLQEYARGIEGHLRIPRFPAPAGASCTARCGLRIQVGNLEAARRPLETGVGVGLLSHSAARRYARRRTIKVVTLNDDWALRPLHIGGRWPIMVRLVGCR
jgi:DNA-binding transcriptional LysR family regulator